MIFVTDCDTAGHWPILILAEDDSLLGRQCLLCGEWVSQGADLSASEQPGG